MRACVDICAEESERLNHKHIGTGHLLLGRVQKGLTFLITLPLMFAFGLWLEGRLFPDGSPVRVATKHVIGKHPGCYSAAFSIACISSSDSPK